jgi:hypothetical protein
MRGIFHDRFLHEFIEGPINHAPMFSSLNQRVVEKTHYTSALMNGYIVAGDDNDIDVPYYRVEDNFEEHGLSS